uniref:Uncharacterized protein n=1 Tax=Cacopsylla melanoneura TaxID=428564 RepID=A0A8D8Z679_9HEMI
MKFVLCKVKDTLNSDGPISFAECISNLFQHVLLSLSPMLPCCLYYRKRRAQQSDNVAFLYILTRHPLPLSSLTLKTLSTPLLPLFDFSTLTLSLTLFRF